MHFVLGIFSIVFGSIFMGIAILLYKKTNDSGWKSGKGIVKEIRTQEYDYEDGCMRESASTLMIEFIDENNNTLIGESNHIGGIKDIERVREKYLNREVEFKYLVKIGNTSKWFTPFFSKAPFIRIYVYDDEFRTTTKSIIMGKIFLFLFSLVFIIQGFLILLGWY